MALKNVIAFALAAVLCVSASVSVSAETTDSAFVDEAVPAYEIAKEASSKLRISGQTAYCTSYANGIDTVSITVEQTLEKYSGFLWIWNDVNDASWTETVNKKTISVSKTKSGLSSGTYRLKSVFTLTDSNGKTETITVYSEEKAIP